MPIFCYWCGLINHDEKDCKIWTESGCTLNKDEQQYGPWLRTSTTNLQQPQVVKTKSTPTSAPPSNHRPTPSPSTKPTSPPTTTPPTPSSKNKTRLGAPRQSCRDIIHKARTVLEEVSLAHLRTPQHKEAADIRWTPSDFPKYKVNTDAAIFSNTKAVGIGVVVRDHEGAVIAALRYWTTRCYL
ncbi:hypothetical protein SO802_009377 [Lithocarpus litseifolius]|uniref:Reverse transcriptase/retrotransposon-derived protein RNase H-like domain-containing protein n=1 Tax=Lithocarpus litseifolius TaxID=425828 RepID=A0AAW2DB78_9ROSI